MEHSTDRPCVDARHTMRLHWRNYDTGWGELLCFVLAWVIGIGGVWLDYARRPQRGAGDRLAVSGARAPVNANLD